MGPDLVKHVIKSLNAANTFRSRLPDSIIGLDGMSGFKTRVFYNELCSLEFPDRQTEYMEVGSWKGSTLCSAMYSNEKCNGTAIDNWSLFGGPKDEFINNVTSFGFENRLKVFEEDVFSFKLSKLQNPIDIYLYDGCHEEISQYKGIVRMWPALAEQAIVVVDDWNGPLVRKGTIDGLNDVGANILAQFEIMYSNDGAHTPSEFAGREFWNGIGIFVISKKPVNDF